MPEKELLVYIDGELVPTNQAKVSVYDHGYLYGDAVFEGIRSYNGRVFKLNEHIDRLYESAQTIDLKIPLTKEEFKQAILKTLRANNLKDAYIRPIVSRGVGDLGLDPRKCSKPTVVIIAQPWGKYYGDAYEKGLKIVTASTRRIPPDCLSPNIKSCNYLNNILARIEAINFGAEEALMLDVRGFVSEATGDNVFIVKKGKLATPPETIVLKGITRRVVFELAKKLNIQVEERDLTLPEIYNADELFLTGTAAEIAPVVEIDGRKIGAGKVGQITRKLMKLYSELTEKEGIPIS
ncbi:MAG: branched-chain-amino-acid transaminase [Euryarchaeota archaeon]|nr:branched-chain-amino-acid transaminase [Euryarchaeota archaeon]